MALETPSVDDSRQHGFLGLQPQALISMSPLKADIYLRLSRERFIKILQSGDVFDEADLRKYRDDKGLEHLYLREGDLGILIQKAEEGLDELKRQGVPPTPTQVSKFHHVTYSLLKDVGDQIGISADMQRLTKKQVGATVDSIQHNWRVSTFLKELSREGGYLAWHSLSLS